MFLQLSTNSLRLLALAALLVTVSCSDKDDKPVQGKSFFKTKQQVMSKEEASSLMEDFFSKIPPAIKNNYWPRNGYIPGENLAFSGTGNVDSFSAGDEPKKGLDITSVPVAAEDKIITLGGRGELQARSVKDLSETIWELQIDEAALSNKKQKERGYLDKLPTILSDEGIFIGGNICYSLGNVFVSTKRGYVIAVNVADGKILWSVNVGGTIRSVPVARESTVVVVTTDNRAIALSTKSGARLWEHQGMQERSQTSGSPAPLLEGNTLVVTYSSGEIFALDFDTGQEKWSAAAAFSAYGRASTSANDISQSPVFHNGSIYIVSSDGTLNAIDQNGGQLWAFEGESINRSPWPVGDYLFTTTEFGELLAISARSGKLIWKSKMADEDDSEEEGLRFTGVVMAGGNLYAAHNQGELYSYSPKDGSIIAKTSIPDAVYLSPVLVNGKMYLLSRESKLIVVE